MICESAVWGLMHVWEYHGIKSHLSCLHNPSIPGLMPVSSNHKSQHPTVIYIMVLSHIYQYRDSGPCHQVISHSILRSYILWYLVTSINTGTQARVIKS